jgi:hypothetical protein
MSLRLNIGVSRETSEGHQAASGTTVEVEFRRPPVHGQIADEVKKLWDEGLRYTQIAQRVGWNRNIVAKAVRDWHRSHGLPAPDGRHHIGRLKRLPRLAEQIAD